MSSAKEDGLVFRRFRRGKDGKVLDAHAYGLKAWPIRCRSMRRT